MSQWLTKNPILVMAIVLFAFVIAQAFWPRASERVKWSSDYAAAMAGAQQDQRPVLVYFTASWCGPCQQMKHTTFADQAVADEVAQWLAVRVDVDEQVDLADSFGVQFVPSFYILTPEGKLLSTYGKIMDSEQILAFLKDAKTRYAGASTGPMMHFLPTLP